MCSLAQETLAKQAALALRILGEKCLTGLCHAVCSSHVVAWSEGDFVITIKD